MKWTDCISYESLKNQVLVLGGVDEILKDFVKQRKINFKSYHWTKTLMSKDVNLYNVFMDYRPGDLFMPVWLGITEVSLALCPTTYYIPLIIAKTESFDKGFFEFMLISKANFDFERG